MGKERLAAFSDGVVAIIITIMVLELRAPHGSGLAALRPLVPALLGYALSFVYVGIYNPSVRGLHSLAGEFTPCGRGGMMPRIKSARDWNRGLLTNTWHGI